jgi:hypothetical protein
MDSGRWEGTPMRCGYVQSSLFEDRSVFPKGSVAFDHALVVRDVAARWVPLPRLTYRGAAAASNSALQAATFQG